MKRIYLLLVLLYWSVGVQTGCGRKGNPVVPAVPQPLPIQNVSARVEHDAITLSWTAPTEYDNNKPLELQDIRTFSIYRKTEVSAANSWNFLETNEGWASASRTFPVKLHQGILRTASKQKSLLIFSQDDLGIAAEDNRYIRLKLWTRNSQQGYITFITNNDKSWDADVDLSFQPAVHTSFYSYHNAFGLRKLRSFPILADEPFAREYLLDMSTISSWKGEIKQIGLILLNNDPDKAVVEIGLDRLEFVAAKEENASFYEAPPWLFLEDQEGWRSSQPGNLLEAVGGVLYTQGADTITLLSKPGQRIKLSSAQQLRIRMKVTAGREAYLVLRTNQQERLPSNGTTTIETSPDMVRIPLKDHAEFHTYTVDVPEIASSAADVPEIASSAVDVPEIASSAADLPEIASSLQAEQEIHFTQVGIVFPALEEVAVRHIVIDYIDILAPGVGTTYPVPELAQPDIPPLIALEQQAREKMLGHNPGFEMSYDDLPTQREQLSTKPVKLAEISPKNPAPAELKEDRFSFSDTGNIIVDDDKEATLDYGARYTYQIEFTDRKKRKSKRSNPVTVEFSRAPRKPSHLKAVPGNKEVRLTWSRPIFTTDGRKIQSLAGYNIFRSSESGQYSATPIARVPAQQTSVSDKNLTNGVRYYYTIQSAISGGSDDYTGEYSAEVSAIPVDNVPPDVPTGVVGVYLGNVVNLYWNQSQSGDLAGFNVYRSQTPDRGFGRINPEAIMQASYKDTAVEANTQYYYRVTSFDNASPPNESPASEITVVDTVTLD